MVVGAEAEGGVCLSAVILLVDISGFFFAQQLDWGQILAQKCDWILKGRGFSAE